MKYDDFQKFGEDLKTTTRISHDPDRRTGRRGVKKIGEMIQTHTIDRVLMSNPRVVTFLNGCDKI